MSLLFCNDATLEAVTFLLSLRTRDIIKLYDVIRNAPLPSRMKVNKFTARLLWNFSNTVEIEAVSIQTQTNAKQQSRGVTSALYRIGKPTAMVRCKVIMIM